MMARWARISDKGAQNLKRQQDLHLSFTTHAIVPLDDRNQMGYQIMMSSLNIQNSKKK